jgi:hypothetical protein
MTRTLFAVLALACGAAHLPPAFAQPGAATAAESSRELLNSERIERAFGSYGIEVIESDARVRVSNLYSEEQGGTRVCRTFAVVLYPAAVDPAFALEHAAIVAGRSIGATFAESGWTVVKTHRYFGEIDSTPRLARLMGGADEQRLAVHVYEFEIVKGGRRFAYATIAEAHHPDYLRLENVREIYGAGLELAAVPDDETQRLLELVAAK